MLHDSDQQMEMCRQMHSLAESALQGTRSMQMSEACADQNREKKIASWKF